MKPSRTSASRGVLVVAVAIIAAGAFATAPATAGKFLTKKRALKLFYTKSGADARYLEEGQLLKGSYTCVGFAWQEGISGQSYTTNFALRTGSGQFRCNVPLPAGATITAVRYSVRDASASGQVTDMALSRIVMAPPFSTTAIAVVPATGTSQTPGDVQLSAPTISDPAVDAGSAYVLGVLLEGSGDTGFAGATIEYMVPAAQGAAA